MAGNRNVNKPEDVIVDPTGTSGVPVEPVGPGGLSMNNPPTPGATVDPLNKDRVVVHTVNTAAVSSAFGERRATEILRRHVNILGKADELIETLSQKFPAKTVAGRTSLQYEYSGTSSGVTSTSGQSVAQTSLFERAQAALSDAERRLGALKPMQTPDDPENLDALRAVTLTTYKRLVRELGLAGGPRDKRANRYFDVLIGLVGPQETAPILDKHSLLAQIEDKFKLVNAGINSAEDSANVANFRIVRDNLFDLFRNWNGFNKEREADFSERAGRFSRFLVMIHDDVTDVETAMDEVNFDATDRDSHPIKEKDTLTIQGLLSWIEEFASEEGPEMVEEGGAIGIGATFPTLEGLAEFVGTLIGLNEAHVKEANVQASLGSLHSHLIQARDLAHTIKGTIR